MLNPNVGATTNIGGKANALATPGIQANIAQNNAMQALALSRINAQQGFANNANDIANSYGEIQQNEADPLNPGNLIGGLSTLAGGVLPSILKPKPGLPPVTPDVNIGLTGAPYINPQLQYGQPGY